MHPIPISSLLKASALAISLAATGFAHAGFFTDTTDETTQDGRFINRKSEGWFWYEVEPEPIEPVPEKKEEPKIVISEQSKPQETKPVEPVDQGPAPLSAAWFRENLPKYKDAAWDNPTPENLRAYLYLQRFVLDRAQQFADSWELAMVGDPLIDEISRRPTANFATPHLDKKANKEQMLLMTTIAKQVGLFFFFSSDCDTCEIQAPVINMLKNSAGFTILPISMDGKALGNGLFPEYKVNAGHAEKMGVTTLPALALVTPDGKFEMIGQGVMALSEMNRRLMVAAKRNGWITEDQFDKTRPVLNMDMNIAELISTQDLKGVLETAPSSHKNPSNFVPSEHIINYFRDNINER